MGNGMYIYERKWMDSMLHQLTARNHVGHCYIIWTLVGINTTTLSIQKVEARDFCA
jgi:hypothetical protein